MDESSSNQLESHLAVFIIIPNWCQKYHPKIHRSVSAKKKQHPEKLVFGGKKGIDFESYPFSAVSLR